MMYLFNLGLKFESVVEKYTNNTALTFENGDSVSYDQLNRRANQFARFLIALGITAKDVIAISGVKEIDTFLAIIACLKIGAIYTVFDPDSPAERVSKIFKSAGPKAFIVDRPQQDKLSAVILESNPHVIYIEEGLRERLSGYSQENLADTAAVTGENPAYIMFTSGSTGFPKGAVMTHQNVLNFIQWSVDTYRISPGDVLTNVNPLYFDNSVFDVYSSLFSGASLVPFTKKTVINPQLLTDLIDQRKCTIWFSVPTLLVFLQTMKALNKNNFKYIRRIIFGGEGYPKPKLKLLFDLYGDRAELFNVYGPTECTCICSSYKITREDFEELHGYPPIGYLIPNFSYLLLDENNHKVADDQLGELCLMGPNVGKGYFNDPERTAGSFMRNPLNEKYHEVMYKTGDLLKYNPKDGKLYIAGRSDNQIKHMGYRIELEEIENAICRLNGVSQAAALHGAVRGLSRIVAVVSTTDALQQAQVIQQLRAIIPDYMVPSEIHFVNELPRNPNGKIDRKGLKAKYLPGSA